MKEIKCPNCQTNFKIDETSYADIIKQVRDEQFNDELKSRLDEVGSFPILELPQLERDENSPNFGQPIMVVNKETGEEEPLILYLKLNTQLLQIHI